jgi:hypothetical protein
MAGEGEGKFIILKNKADMTDGQTVRQTGCLRAIKFHFHGEISRCLSRALTQMEQWKDGNEDKKREMEERKRVDAADLS